MKPGGGGGIDAPVEIKPLTASNIRDKTNNKALQSLLSLMLYILYNLKYLLLFGKYPQQ